MSDPEKSKADEQLAGVWRHSTAEGEVTYLHVGRAGGKIPRGIMLLLTVAHSKEEVKNSHEPWLMFSTVVGDNRYLNLALVTDEQLNEMKEKGWNPNLIAGYFIAKYQVSGDTLAIRSMDQAVKRNAIESGKVRGTMESRPLITDTRENLLRFIVAAGDSLFSKAETRLERVK